MLLTAPRRLGIESDQRTASEVAQLKLNADWVVLSACNTAGRGSSVGPCARLLLRRRPRAAALTLANRFEGGDPIGHIDVRHHELQPDHRPRGGAASRNARLCATIVN
jgi:hypothetical protein